MTAGGGGVRHRPRRGAPWILLGALGAAAVLGACSAEEPPAPPRATRPSSEFVGVEVSEEDADGTRWRVKAERGSAWERDGTGHLEGVTAVFERGSGRLTLTAGQGQIEERRSVRLSDGVRVEWGPYSAELDQATYHRGEGVVRSQSPVVFRGPGLVVRGRGLEVDVEGRRARVPAEVRATLTRREGS